MTSNAHVQGPWSNLKGGVALGKGTSSHVGAPGQLATPTKGAGDKKRGGIALNLNLKS